jgi:hypothetical protein
MKQKLLIIACVAALIVGATTVVSFASTGQDPVTAIKGVFVVKMTAGDKGDGATQSLAVRETENGREMSTDGGKTWTPVDAETIETENGGKIEFGTSDAGSADGQAAMTEEGAVPSGDVPDGAESLTVVTEDGETKYSDDGGETWSDAPESGEVSVTDGKVTITE